MQDHPGHTGLARSRRLKMVLEGLGERVEHLVLKAAPSDQAPVTGQYPEHIVGVLGIPQPIDGPGVKGRFNLAGFGDANHRDLDAAGLLEQHWAVARLADDQNRLGVVDEEARSGDVLRSLNNNAQLAGCQCNRIPPVVPVQDQQSIRFVAHIPPLLGSTSWLDAQAR
jgi:hypothetical protein